MESAVACALGEPPVLSARSLAPPTPVTLPPLPPLPRYQVCHFVVFVCMGSLATPPYLPVWSYCLHYPGSYTLKNCAKFSSWTSAPFFSPYSGHASTHTGHAPAANSASPWLPSLIPRSPLPFTHASVCLCFPPRWSSCVRLARFVRR